MHVIEKDDQRLVPRERGEVGPDRRKQRRLTGTAAKSRRRAIGNAWISIGPGMCLLQRFDPQAIRRGLAAVVTMSEENERSRLTCLTTGTLSERGLADPGLTTEDDEAPFTRE